MKVTKLDIKFHWHHSDLQQACVNRSCPIRKEINISCNRGTVHRQLRLRHSAAGKRASSFGMYVCKMSKFLSEFSVANFQFRDVSHQSSVEVPALRLTFWRLCLRQTLFKLLLHVFVIRRTPHGCFLSFDEALNFRNVCKVFKVFLMGGP
jgi:hypothetical protein